jgi:hypothetical protein
MSLFRRFFVNHIQLVLLVVIAMGVGVASGGPILFLRISPSQELLKVLVEASVQILAFGGVALGIIYPSHRNLVRALRETRLVWGERLNKFNAQPQEYLKRGMTSQYVLERIRDLSLQIDDARGFWGFTLATFAVAFVLFGVDLLLMIGHLAGYELVSNFAVTLSAGVLLPVGPFMFCLEVIAFMVGIELLLIAFIRGAILPEGPVTIERMLPPE